MTRVTAAVRTTFRSLRYRNYRLFLTGQLISQAGTWLTMIALVLLVLHRTNKNGLAIGLLTACQFAPILVLGAFGGLVADRCDKRKLLLVTQTLEMLQSFGLVALAGGTMLAFDNPARRSFVSEMTPKEDLQNAVTLNSALMTSSRVIGPAIAGLLVVTTGYGWCFTIDAISYLAVIASLWVMRTEELYPAPAASRARGQVREGLRYVRRVPDLRIPLVMMTVVGLLTFNFSVVIPLFVEKTLGGSDGTYTLLYSVLSLGSLAGALFASHRHFIGIRTIVVAALGFGATMMVFSAAPNLATSFPIALVVGFASVMFMR